MICVAHFDAKVRSDSGIFILAAEGVFGQVGQFSVGAGAVHIEGLLQAVGDGRGHYEVVGLMADEWLQTQKQLYSPLRREAIK